MRIYTRAQGRGEALQLDFFFFFALVLDACRGLGASGFTCSLFNAKKTSRLRFSIRIARRLHMEGGVIMMSAAFFVCSGPSFFLFPRRVAPASVGWPRFSFHLDIFGAAWCFRLGGPWTHLSGGFSVE